jgi:DNA-binding NarL/FixJ family response regulator
MMKITQIIIASSQRLFRESLSNAFQGFDNIKIQGEVNSGKSVVDLAGTLCPDIIILDTNLPDMDGLKVVQRLISNTPKTKIIILSEVTIPHYIWNMINIGISGYLPKSCSLEELVNAVHMVVTGQLYLSPEIAGLVVKTISATAPRDPVFTLLSQREREVLQLISEGHKPKEIAKKLFISPKTVQIHQTNLKQKLNLTNTAELTRYAVAKGITSLDFFVKHQQKPD